MKYGDNAFGDAKGTAIFLKDAAGVVYAVLRFYGGKWNGPFPFSK